MIRNYFASLFTQWFPKCRPWTLSAVLWGKKIVLQQYQGVIFKWKRAVFAPMVQKQS